MNELACVFFFTSTTKIITEQVNLIHANISFLRQASLCTDNPNGNTRLQTSVQVCAAKFVQQVFRLYRLMDIDGYRMR